MENTADRAIAIVGAGAVLPDAKNVAEFWENVKNGRDSISEVPSDRWSIKFYYDPDRTAADKTYSKIGGWVREYAWNPIAWKMPVPPRVADSIDDGQKWAVACTRETLQDYGHPERSLDPDRTAVVLGNAMGGERHYMTSLRVFFPEYASELEQSETFSSLPASLKRDITREMRERISRRLPPITEDTMPGELANCIAGRVANLFNLHGPNFVTDAACASAMAAISAAADGLVQHDFDVAISGGIDHIMGASIFVKFCNIGTLSATGSRPYAQGADGFVMGEGAAMLILKCLADAERDGDRIHAVLRSIGGSSDRRGKGITAPNPAGQKLCLERAWQNAGLSPATATSFEGHGTSTTVGDVVEANALSELLDNRQLLRGSVALGSVKSNIGHLKAAAGAAGILKATLALRDKVLPPRMHCETPNPNIDFEHSALYVNKELKPLTEAGPDGVRRVGVSAFGFGGTNFHAVLEEYIPHRSTGNGRNSIAVTVDREAITDKETSITAVPAAVVGGPIAGKPPLRGALVVGAPSAAALGERLRSIHTSAQAGVAPAPAVPIESDLRATERIAIDYGNAAELADKTGKALKSLEADQPATWKALRAQGIFRGSGPAPRAAFLYTSQGSQYVNMLKPLRAIEPIVADTFAEADRIMVRLLGKPLSDFVFVDATGPDAIAKAENDLRQTAITQPAVLAADAAFTRLLAAYGIEPDMVMGHILCHFSVREYNLHQTRHCLPKCFAVASVQMRAQ